MNDRELLVLAAKAAGIKGECYEVNGRLLIAEEAPAVGGLTYYPSPPWMPFDDDAQAFRLAVSLCMTTTAMTAFCGAKPNFGGSGFDLPIMGDRVSAMRRAIVSVAADLGKRLQAAHDEVSATKGQPT